MELQRVLWSSCEVSIFSRKAHDFEKDDDTNFHIDFLTAQCLAKASHRIAETFGHPGFYQLAREQLWHQAHRKVNSAPRELRADLNCLFKLFRSGKSHRWPYHPGTGDCLKQKQLAFLLLLYTQASFYVEHSKLLEICWRPRDMHPDQLVKHYVWRDHQSGNNYCNDLWLGGRGILEVGPRDRLSVSLPRPTKACFEMVRLVMWMEYEESQPRYLTLLLHIPLQLPISLLIFSELPLSP